MDPKKEKAAKRMLITMGNKNMRQQEVSDLTGIPKSSISHYSNGIRIPDVRNAYKIAKVLGVTAEYLMCEDDADFMVVEKNELQKELADASPEQLSQILEFVKFIKRSKEENK